MAVRSAAAAARRHVAVRLAPWSRSLGLSVFASLIFFSLLLSSSLFRSLPIFFFSILTF